MGFEKGNKHGKKFAKGEVTNPNGRPKKIVSKILEGLKEKGEIVTASMVKDTYQVLMSLNEKQLKTIANDKEQPMINRIVAKEMLGKKGFEIIEKMLDRANGKATQKQEINQNVKVDRFQFEMPEATPEMQKKWEEAQNKEE